MLTLKTGSLLSIGTIFGILALQMDFIRRDDLIAAMHAWVLDKAKPLGQLLVEQQALRADKRQLLEAHGEALDTHSAHASRLSWF